jgi:hypothetical protein
MDPEILWNIVYNSEELSDAQKAKLYVMITTNGSCMDI